MTESVQQEDRPIELHNSATGAKLQPGAADDQHNMAASAVSTAAVSPTNTGNGDNISFGFTCNANSFSFGDETSPECWHCVPVTYSISQSTWECLAATDMFQHWVRLYISNPSVVTAVDVKACGDDSCEWAVIVPRLDLAGAVSTAGLSLSTSEKILLQRTSSMSVPEVGVLVILRCVYDNNSNPQTTIANNNVNNRGRNTNNSNNNTWTRDIVLFSVVNRPAVGPQPRFEILKGVFDKNDEFSSPQADDMQNVLGIKIHKQDLFPMTPTEVAPAPACLSQTLDLYLYRRTITASQLSLLQQHNNRKTTDENMDNSSGKTEAVQQEDDSTDVVSASIRLKSAAMGEAWRMTSDATSMAALFLFHEYRYYRLMPRYQPPRDLATTDTSVKQKPQFVSVSGIHPTMMSVNLKVRIVEPVQQQSVDAVDAEQLQSDDDQVASRPDTRPKDTFCVVGDSTGVIKLRLVGGQSDSSAALSVIGTNLTLRNAVVSVVDMTLLVSLNKWGKLTVIDNPIEIESDFNFEVDTVNNQSALEYELVSRASLRNDSSTGSNVPTNRSGQRFGQNRGRNNPRPENY
eukprot:Lankesteria_metandrocarpae@DN4983_c0_g1_i2.p1